MIQTTSVKSAVFALSLTIAFAVSAFAQEQTGDRNYDISLHLVIGSNDPAMSSRAEVPKELDGIVRQVKSGFSFGSYKLLSTFVGRVGEAGQFSYQSVANIDGKDMPTAVPTFLDWSLQDLRGGPSGRALKAQAFRFGARLPISTGGGEGRASISYENIGLTVQKLGLTESSPTLIGTVHLPGTGGTIFVIMTVRAT